MKRSKARMASFDPSTLLLLYDRRAEIYTMDTKTDSSVSEYHPLFHEGVPPGHSMFFSQDGQRIYQNSYMGNFKYVPAEEMLYCWGAYTGDLLWEIAVPREGSVYSLSADGRTIWRIYDGTAGTDVERLDGASGRSLMSVHWSDHLWYFQDEGPTESKDGTRAFFLNYYQSNSELFLLFDPRTGEVVRMMNLGPESAYLKENDPSGEGDGDSERNGFSPGGRILPQERTGSARAFFSDDGGSVYLIQNALRKEDGVSGVCIDRLDAGTGEVLDERFLGIGEQDIRIWEEEEAVVLIDKLPDEKNDFISSVNVDGVWIYPSAVATWRGSTVTHTVRIIDLKGKDPDVEVPFSYRKSPDILNMPLQAVRPFDGGMALYWEAGNEDGDAEDLCCLLNRDGSTGKTYPADSGEGRRLWIEKDRYLTFNGQEAYLSAAGIRRLSDGALLLGNGLVSSGLKTGIISEGNDTFEKGKDYGIAASGDGRSICMYDPKNSYVYPFLILPSDLDTLAAKAKRRLGGL